MIGIRGIDFFDFLQIIWCSRIEEIMGILELFVDRERKVQAVFHRLSFRAEPRGSEKLNGKTSQVGRRSVFDWVGL